MKIVRVDMKTKEVTRLAHENYRYLGGRALTSKMTLDEVDPGCEPLGRLNKLFIAPGLLAGTNASSASRLSVGGKSPLTNGIKEANSGGIIGQKLAKAGVRAIVLEDKNDVDNLYVLKIDKDGAHLLVQNELKGLGTYDTMNALLDKYGKGVAILCVGPGGERGLRSAAIAMNDPYGELKFAARGGLGAVMGTKGLKAIVVDDQGLSELHFHDREKFMAASKSLNAQLLGDPKTKEVYQRYGTSGIVKAVNAMGALPTNNFRYGQFVQVDNISGEALYENVVNRGGAGKTGIACMRGCVIKCSNVYPDENGKKIVSTLQYENISLLGSNLGIGNLDEIARLNHEVNDIGLDAIEAGAALGVALDMGLGKFGSFEDCMTLLSEVRRDTIVGRLIGNGAQITGVVLGCNRIPAAKGQGFPGYDPRALKGNGATYAMSPMGADHTAGNCFGARNEVNPVGTAEQGDLSKKIQGQMGTLDSLGFCIFARNPLFKDPNLMASLVNHLTGSDFDGKTIWDIGLETVSVEREFNVAAGISPAYDRLPEYCYHETLESVNGTFDLSAEEMEKAIID